MYLKKFTLWAGILSLLACQGQEQKNTETEAPKAQETSESPAYISCKGIGKVKFTMSYDDVEREFGKENLQSDTILAGTEMLDQEPPTEDQILTEVNTPKGKILITWAVGKTAQTIEKISLHLTESDKPQYTFENGIGLGSSFQDFKDLNQGDFEFYGLGWEYGGLIVSEGASGTFFQNYPCVSGSFATLDGQYDKVQDIMGDQTFKASKINPSVGRELVLSSITLEKK